MRKRKIKSKNIKKREREREKVRKWPENNLGQTNIVGLAWLV
jgi:hypothetical protein